MFKQKDISGERFGKLVALRPVGKDSRRKTIWECRCSSITKELPKLGGGQMGKPNVRYSNGARRRAIRARWKSIGAPCALCGKPI